MNTFFETVWSCHVDVYDIYQQKHVDLLLGVELVLASAARAALPWAPNLACMAALFAVTGGSLGAANPSTTTMTTALTSGDDVRR